MATYQPLFAALVAARIRFVVVGGLAVVLHGHARLTVDVDLVVDLGGAAPEIMNALTALGYRPRLPVDASSFADPVTRESWIRDKGLTAFTMVDPSDPLKEVDLLVDPVVPFEQLFARSETVQVEGVDVPVASIEDLITLKEVAGRPRDLEDIEALREIRDGQS